MSPRFRADSFWYVPIPSDAPLHANNLSLVAEFQRQRMEAANGVVAINTFEYASPLYLADDTVLPQKVTIHRCLDGVPDAVYEQIAQQLSDVPIPDFAVQADGTDGEMSIYRPATDTLWELWRATKNGPGWEACWGGKIENVRENPGFFNAPFGVTATSLSFLGGQITAEELQAGKIEHAMGIALIRAKRDSYCWPAQRDDGVGCDGTANCIEEELIEEGQRFRLDPTIPENEIQTLQPVARMIARAAQLYGFVVWDKAGATSLRAKNPKSYTQLGQPDPYPDIFAPYDEWSVLKDFPWDRIQFLPRDYGKPTNEVAPPLGRY